MKDAVLLIDCGTSGEKWTILIREADGSCRVLESQKRPASAERVRSDGAREWNPAGFIERTVDIVFKAAHRAHQEEWSIRGICATGTTSSVVALRRLNLLQQPPPIRWDDRRALLEAAVLENLRKCTNAAPWMTVTSDSALARAFYLASHHPSELANEHTRMIEQLSLFSLFWTGSNVVPETIACRKWGLTRANPWPDRFRDALVDLFRLSLGEKCRDQGTWFHGKFLPAQMIGAGEVVGTILPDLATLYHLPRTAVVVSAPYDTLCQVIGLGLLHLPRSAGVSLGTSLGVCALVPDYSSTPYTRYGPLPEVPAPGHGLLFEGLGACGSAIQLVCEMVGAMKDGHPAYEVIEQAIVDTQPGSSDVRVVPYFGGGRRAIDTGAPIIEGYHPGRQNDLIRALFESFAYHIRIFIEEFERILESRLESILVGGGLVANAPFMQLLADITGRNVVVSAFRDSGLLGCGVCGAVGLGWYCSLAEASRHIVLESQHVHPRQDLVQKYDSLFQAYCRDFDSFIDKSTEAKK